MQIPDDDADSAFGIHDLGPAQQSHLRGPRSPQDQSRLDRQARTMTIRCAATTAPQETVDAPSLTEDEFFPLSG